MRCGEGVREEEDLCRFCAEEIASKPTHELIQIMRELALTK